MNEFDRSTIIDSLFIGLALGLLTGGCCVFGGTYLNVMGGGFGRIDVYPSVTLVIGAVILWSVFDIIGFGGGQIPLKKLKS